MVCLNSSKHYTDLCPIVMHLSQEPACFKITFAAVVFYHFPVHVLDLRPILKDHQNMF